jgi:hypothetical protein
MLVYAQNAWKLLCKTNYVEKNVYYIYYTCSPIPPNWNRNRPGKNGMGKPCYRKFYGEDAFVKRTLPRKSILFRMKKISTVTSYMRHFLFTSFQAA